MAKRPKRNPPPITDDILRQQIREFGIEEQAKDAAEEIAAEFLRLSRGAIGDTEALGIAENLRQSALDAAATGEVLRQLLVRRTRLMDGLRKLGSPLGKAGRANQYDALIVNRFEHLLRIPTTKDEGP